jgi:hypothetical protein
MYAIAKRKAKKGKEEKAKAAQRPASRRNN